MESPAQTKAAVLSVGEWRSAAGAHRLRIERLLGAKGGYDATRHAAHPVYNFLFGYYKFKPARLMDYSAGAGVRMRDAAGSLAVEGSPLVLSSF